MILELVKFTGKDWGQKFTEKASEPFLVKLFGLYQLNMYITEKINETDHKDVLYNIPCHPRNHAFFKLFRYQSRETCIGVGRLFLDVKTCETQG